MKLEFQHTSGVVRRAAGHLRIAKTLTRIARKYYGPGMFRTAAKYFRTYDNIQKHNAQQQVPSGMMHATPVLQLWEMIFIDFLGPLLRSKAGHTYMVVILDRFTK